MSNGFNYTYTCEKCGRDFYSKVDPSGWRHKICNGCSGKTYKDYPVNQTPTYSPQPVPISKPQETFKPQPVKKGFDLSKYIDDMFLVYALLKEKADTNRCVIPEESLCSWTTSIMIQMNK